MQTKICHKCGHELPATTEYFYRDKRYKEAFRSPCKECCKAIVDKDHLAKRTKKYRDSHKEESRIYQREYYIKNKDRKRTYKHTNQEYFTKSHRRYVELHREKVRASNKAWEAANKEKRNEQARIHWMKRKAQKISNGGTVTIDDVRSQYDRQKGKCYYCGVEVGKKYHIDHVVPLSRGGLHAPENIVIACPHCNVTKSNRLPHEWDKSGRLL